MARTYDPDDVPSIGDRRHNHIFVCHGDNRPTEWTPWLEDIVVQFESLEEQAGEVGHSLQWKGKKLQGWLDFCEAIGITFSKNFWEGSLTSGNYCLGWLPVGKLRQAKTTARALLKAVGQPFLDEATANRLKELEEIKKMKERLETLQQENKSLVEQAEHQAALSKLADCSVLDRTILEFTLDLMTGRPAPFIAGPLALWRDGTIYAITQVGRVSLPQTSSTVILLDHLDHTGQSIVRLRETTVAASYLNPCFRQGGAYASEWLAVWFDAPQFKRYFSTEDGQPCQVASEIAEEIKSWKKDE